MKPIYNITLQTIIKRHAHHVGKQLARGKNNTLIGDGRVQRLLLSIHIKLLLLMF